MEAKMDLGSGARFARYVDALGGVIGHAGRTKRLRDYLKWTPNLGPVD
jgi:hypothetical protein